MAHNELSLDSNIVDVAFSKSGTRIAILMKDCFSIFLWSLKSRPVVSPILESSYPLSETPNSRPRQIAFANEHEVYILKDNGPNNTNIERTALETRSTQIAYQAADSEQILSIFTSLGRDSLWLSHVKAPNQPISYSYISMPSSGEFQVVPWLESPTVDTYWAKAVQVSEDEVILSQKFVVRQWLTSQRMYWCLWRDQELYMPTSGSLRRTALPSSLRRPISCSQHPYTLSSSFT